MLKLLEHATHLHFIELGQEIPGMHHAGDVARATGKAAEWYHAGTLAHLKTGKRMQPLGGQYC